MLSISSAALLPPCRGQHADCSCTIGLSCYQELAGDAETPKEEGEHWLDDKKKPDEPSTTPPAAAAGGAAAAPGAAGGGGALTEKQMASLPLGEFLGNLTSWHRQRNHGYVWKKTILATEGAGLQFKEIAAKDGAPAAAKWAAQGATNTVKDVVYMRELWMVIAATTCTLFVAMQWGFAANMMPQFLERNYGEGQPSFKIHSINLWGCIIGPPIVAALSGHLEAGKCV